MSQAASKPANGKTPLDAFVTEKYQDKGTGEEKTRYHEVGKVWPHSTGGGMTLTLHPNIAVQGDVVIFPRREKRSPADNDGQD